KPGATPVYSRAREVPLAFHDKYAEEIETKLVSGYYEKVEFSEWASSTHIVVKKNGKIRVTGNYKPTLNQHIIIDEHPIPKPEHLFNRMKNAVIRPKRSVYGAANIPAIWQRRIEKVLQFFNVEFKPTKANANADYCSRMPLPTTTETVHEITTKHDVTIQDEFNEFALCQIKQLPVRAEHIGRETRKDPELGKIVQLFESDKDLARAGYKAPENKYTLVANCLLFEHRVVIPISLRDTILSDLHASHIGIVKMKGIARSFVYWHRRSY
ncbi:Uncharacterized protein K02A2.6, partial [Trachymyrmex cornetzi]